MYCQLEINITSIHFILNVTSYEESETCVDAFLTEMWLILKYLTQHYVVAKMVHAGKLVYRRLYIL
jgi:hypothetical protein